jgi:type I restriction enzyme S subunit
MSRYKAYAEYKDSGVEWLDQAPSHWSSIALKYMALEEKSLFIDGDWIESKDISGDDIRYITTGNVGEGVYKEQGAGFISSEKFVELNCTEVFCGDILISRLNSPIGRSCIVPNLDARVVTSVDNVIFRPDRMYSKGYLVHLFSSPAYFEHTANLARGATMQRISRGLLGNIRAIIPPKSEQERIAAFLDHETAKIDDLIEKQQRLIELLKEKRQAVISHAVTKGLDPSAPMKDSGVEWLGDVPAHWVVAGFKKYLSSIVDYRGKTPEKHDDGVFLVTARNIKNGKINYDASQEYIAESDYEEVMSRGKPRIGDLLFTTEAPLGEVASVDNEDIALAQRVIKFRTNLDRLNNDYLKYLIISCQFQQSLRMFSSGSTAPGIKAERFVYLRALIPPLNEQRNIVQHIEVVANKMDFLIERAKTAIETIQERRTALISAAVTGKIDVRDWQAAA